MKNINILITGPDLAQKLAEHMDQKSIKVLSFVKCTGFSAKFNFWEFVGVAETQKVMLAFTVSKQKSGAIKRFVKKYYNKKNNGIMFALNGDEEMGENVLYVAVVNSGKGEEIVEAIRKNAMVGATTLEARGNGFTENELFGVEIGSGKDVVLSVMKKESLSAVQKSVKNVFKEQNSDVVSFAMPVFDFDKLHQDN
jgi:hypothetical protein